LFFISLIYGPCLSWFFFNHSFISRLRLSTQVEWRMAGCVLALAWRSRFRGYADRCIHARTPDAEPSTEKRFQEIRWRWRRQLPKINNSPCSFFLEGNISLL
jgi:hypothetical protein